MTYVYYRSMYIIGVYVQWLLQLTFEGCEMGTPTQVRKRKRGIKSTERNI